MVGFPYDDLDTWRAVYPAEIFSAQLERVAEGFDRALARLREAVGAAAEQPALAAELRVAEAAAIHFRSVAAQARFVRARDALAAARDGTERQRWRAALAAALAGEIERARRLHALQQQDSRLGFESSNQYYYVPLDLVEKVLNCRDLMERWLPAQD
jgi:hypothetical protein